MHTVHLFPPNELIYGTVLSLCCGKTWDAIIATPEYGIHKHTKNPECKFSKDGVACAGWPGLGDEADYLPKLTCMICGWPRIPSGAVKQNGCAVQEGEVIPNQLYIDGMLVKVFCGKHCDGCAQPPENCQCCHLCNHYPCKCGQMPKLPATKAKSHTKTMHVVMPKAQHSLCCLMPKSSILNSPLHEYMPQYDPNYLPSGYKWCTGALGTKNTSGDVHGFYFDIPQQYKCHVCSKHMKNCVCENGPTDSKGEKIQLTTTHEGKPITIQTACMVPGWISRGQVPNLKHTDADKAWPNMKPDKHDPVEMAADFYLYHAIISGGVNVKHECEGPCTHNISQMFALVDPPVRAEARILLDQLVTEADLVFREYIDMACGGELRHHPSVGSKGVLNGNRSRAWAEWRDVRDLVGTRALLDMADLFVDCNATTGGVCGQRWQQAALLLYRRLTGQVKPEVFVDQVFTLVHNGGVFLNKRAWKGNHLALLQGSVLPAQAADDFDTLLSYASPTAVEVWNDAWKAINYCRIRTGVRPVAQVRIRSISVCQRCGLASFQGHREWDCRDADFTKVTGKHDIELYRGRKVHPHFDWGFKKFWLYDYDDDNANGPYYRCSLVGPDYLTARNLLDKEFKVLEGKRTLTITDGDYDLLKLPISKFKGQKWKLMDLIELHGLQVSVRTQYGVEVNL